VGGQFGPPDSTRECLRCAVNGLEICTSAVTVALSGCVASWAMAQAPAKAPVAKAPVAKAPVAGQAVAPAAAPAAAPKAANVVTAEQAKLPLLEGGVSEEALEQLIVSLGLKPAKQLQRYDFAFKADMEGQEWTLSMSAVLSQDQQALWLMAWLDELPKSSDAVPRAALLRLLAENDTLGDGKMFAYIPNNRRFVMQRSVPNADMTSAKFRDLLQDLGASVVETYGVWSTSQWAPSAAPAAGTAAAVPGGAPAATQAAATPAAQIRTTGKPLNTATNDPKTAAPVRKN